MGYNGNCRPISSLEVLAAQTVYVAHLKSKYLTQRQIANLKYLLNPALYPIEFKVHPLCRWNSIYELSSGPHGPLPDIINFTMSSEAEFSPYSNWRIEIVHPISLLKEEKSSFCNSLLWFQALKTYFDKLI